MLPRHHVARPDLVALLRAAPVTLVEAPSGYGKTTLASEDARTQTGPVVWLGLDD